MAPAESRIIRAIVFDLYGTLLEFGPPPADADARWTQAWLDTLGRPPRLNLPQFTEACRTGVASEHAAARARGIPFPEVFWPDIVDSVLPEFSQLSTPLRSTSPIYGADLVHTVRLMPGAADALRAAHAAGLHLGLASNCQPYSLRELATALTKAGLSTDLFDPRLTFLSFENGFSKPDPHVFRLLTARLRTLGLTPAEALMVGDRLDNDLAPAEAHGWQTARIDRDTASADWQRLTRRFAAAPTTCNDTRPS